MNDDPSIDCTIREMGRTIAKLDGATLADVEKAAAPTQPFSDQDRAAIRKIAASGRRVHLMVCSGSRYIAGITTYLVCGSAKEARDRGWRSVTSV